MNSYDRVFGSRPRGASIATALFILTYYLEDVAELGVIFSNDVVRFSFFAVFSLTGCAVIIWSLISLPPKQRGVNLATKGAYKYFRHPLYAAFLLFLNLGFALLFNNWIYLIWAIVLLPVWSINVRSEEKLMESYFGKEYVAYCRKTWRFLPKLWNKT